MYFYFDKSKYYISAKRYPYLNAEQIKKHNGFTQEVEGLIKEARGLSKLEERYKTIASLILCAFLVAIACAVLIYLNLGFLFTFSFLLIGLWGMISEALPDSAELKLRESTIKEKIDYLESELLKFEQLKKNFAEYWLSMNGWQFEKEVAKLYEAHGYNAVVTKGSDDGGIDIFLTKDGARYGVQCKNYRKPVAQVVIRELAGAMMHENLDGGIVIASSGYTKRAKEFASNKPIKLMDINDVLRMHGSVLKYTEGN